jgi:hypothetical protein
MRPCFPIATNWFTNEPVSAKIRTRKEIAGIYYTEGKRDDTRKNEREGSRPSLPPQSAGRCERGGMSVRTAPSSHYILYGVGVTGKIRTVIAASGELIPASCI